MILIGRRSVRAGPAARTRQSMSEPTLRRFVADFFESAPAAAALIVLVTIIALALAAPLIAAQNPYNLAEVDVRDSQLAPAATGVAGNTYWLGTDGMGRDLVSAMLYGLRISLFVGVASGLLAVILGTIVGLSATLAGGRLGELLMRIVDLQLALPAVLVALILVAALGNGADKIIIALVIVQWAYYARVVRGAALSEQQKGYVEAARCLGLSNARILVAHILPNCLPPLIVVATLQAANAIALEATLSFLGVGLPRSEPSLGLLIANGFEYMLSGKYWISVLPGAALVITLMAINLVGDRLRDQLNPGLQQ
jgi:peptide/nickel transport system permease protein